MNEKKDKVKFAWFARTYNNSRSPVTIASMVVDIGKSDSSGNLDWTAYNVLTSNKYDAYHLLSDQAVFVKGDESTSVGRLIPLSQVCQYLGLAGRSRNGGGFDFFERR